MQNEALPRPGAHDTTYHLPQMLATLAEVDAATRLDRVAA
jgi:hypothetical protein